MDSVTPPDELPAPDTTPPEVIIVAPEADSHHNSDIAMTGTAKDDQEVALVEVSTDGVTFELATGTTAWSADIDVSALDDGLVVLTARAADPSGNIGESSITVGLDRVAPTAVLANLPANITSNASLAVTVGGTDVVAYRYRLDGGAWQGPFDVELPIEVTHLDDGEHTLDVVGRDLVGNWQSEPSATSYTWTVNTTDPIVELTGTPPGVTNQTSFVITVGGINVVTYRYQLNGADSASALDVSAPIELEDLAEGPYELLVWGKSGAGVEQPTPTIVSFKVDVTPPTLKLTPENPTSPTNAASANFLAEASQSEIVTFHWTVTRTGSDCSSSQDSSLGLSASIQIDNTVCDGNYQLSMTATDAAGNISPAVEREYRVDRTPPSVTLMPANPASPTNASSIELTAATSPSEDVTFNWTVTRTGTGCSDSDGSSAGTSAVVHVDNTVCDGSYQVSVTATDALGNTSAAVIRNYDVDRTPPHLSISPQAPSSPTNVETRGFTATSFETVTFDWTVTRTGEGCSDSQGSITGLQEAINVDNTVCDGSYELAVTATDALGNTSAPVVRHYDVDRTAPVITLTPEDLPSATNADETVLAATTGESVSFEWTITRVGSGCSSSEGASAGLQAEIRIDNTVCEGSYQLALRATDAAGNTSSTVLRTYKVDRTPPSFTLTPQNPTSPTSAASTVFTATTSPSEEVTFDWTVSRTGSGCSQTQGSSDGTSAGFDIDNTVCDGSYELSVTATDAAGNTSATVVRLYSVDRTPPIFTLTPENPPSPTNAASTLFTATTTPKESVTFDWTVTRTGTGCSNSQGSSVGGSANIDVDNTLCNGTHELSVTATDAAGNSAFVVRNYIAAAIPPQGVALFIGGPDPRPEFPTPSRDVEWILERPSEDVTAFSYSVSGATTRSGSGTFSGEFARLRLSSLNEGTSTVTVCLANEFGVTQTSCGTVRTVTVDVTPPSAPTIVAGPGVTNSWAPSFEIDVPDGATLSYRLSDNSGRLFADGEGSDGNLRFSALPDGLFALALWAVDAAGNVSASTKRAFHVRRAPPVFELEGLPHAYSTADHIEVKVLVKAGVPKPVTYAYKLTGDGAFSPETNIDELIERPLTTSGLQSLLVRVTDGAGNQLLREYRWFFDGGGLPRYYVTNSGNNTNDCKSPATACRQIHGALNKDADVNRVILVGPGAYTGQVSRANFSYTVVGGFDSTFIQWQLDPAAVTFSSTGGISCSGAECGVIGITIDHSGANPAFQGIGSRVSFIGNHVSGERGVTATGDAYIAANTLQIAGNAIHVSGATSTLASIVNNDITSPAAGLALTLTAGGEVVVRGNTVTASADDAVAFDIQQHSVSEVAQLTFIDNVQQGGRQGVSVRVGAQWLGLMLYRNRFGTLAEGLRGSDARGLHLHQTVGSSETKYVAAIANEVYLHRSGGDDSCTHTGLFGVHLALSNAIHIDATANGVGCDSYTAYGLSELGDIAADNSVTAELLSGDATLHGIVSSPLRVPSIAHNQIDLPSAQQSYGLNVRSNFVFGNTVRAFNCLVGGGSSGANHFRHNHFSCGSDTSVTGGELDFAHNTIENTSGASGLAFTLESVRQLSMRLNTFSDVRARIDLVFNPPANPAPIRIYGNQFSSQSGSALTIDGELSGPTYVVTFVNNGVIAPTGVTIDSSPKLEVVQLVSNTIVANQPIITAKPIRVLANNIFWGPSAGIGSSAVHFTAEPFMPDVAFANSYGGFTYALSRSSGTYAGCRTDAACRVNDLTSSNEGIRSESATFIDVAGGNLRLAVNNPCSITTGGLQYEEVLPATLSPLLLEVRGRDVDDLPRTLTSGPDGCPGGVSRGFSELD